MTEKAILLAGGSGFLGRQVVRWLRARHPDLPLLIGGRNQETAARVAHQAGHAQPVKIDLHQAHLGMPSQAQVAAVVMLAPDPGLNGMAYAQALGVPYLSIANGLVEMGAELALFAARPHAAPIVLASHWFGGSAVFMALQAASAFDSVRTIHISAILDEQDDAGPVAWQDMEHFQAAAPTAMVFKDGQRTWLPISEAKTEIQTIDGRTVPAQPYAPPDIVGLFAATHAPNIRFDIYTGQSSSRVRGGRPAAEIIVNVEGDIGGRAHRSTSTLEFIEGQAALTGLSVVLSLTAAMGLNGAPAKAPGIYLPEGLWTPTAFLEELEGVGVELSVPVLAAS